MIEFPNVLEKILNKIAEQYKVTLKKDTHYETINRVLAWFEKNIYKRIDFTVIVDNTTDQKFIVVTYLENVYPKCIPVFFRWLEKNIPFLILFKKNVKWENIDRFPINLNKDDIEERLRKTIIPFLQTKAITKQ